MEQLNAGFDAFKVLIEQIKHALGNLLMADCDIVNTVKLLKDQIAVE